MKKQIFLKIFVSSILLILITNPSLLFAARSNILTTGLSVSLDFDERDYTYIDDPDTDIDERTILRAEDDLRELVITPLVIYRSYTPRDNFEVTLQPDLRYDLLDYGTDWNGDFRLEADRFINRSWQLAVSNHFYRTDYYRSSSDLTGVSAVPTEQRTGQPDTDLSPDIGRTRYSRNILNLYSDYFYRQDSLFRIGGDYSLLRYDEDPTIRQEDYDRYELFLINDHRFSSIWRSVLDYRFIRGDFDVTDPEVADAIIGEIAPEADIPLSTDDLSNDVKENRLLFELYHESIPRNPLYLQYYYVNAEYDDVLRNDNNLHQFRFNWRRDFSSNTYTILGAGPSYAEIENQDSRWDGNGIAELGHITERGTYNVAIEKMYDVINFDGTSQQGPRDYWEARLTLDYRLSRNLTLTGRLRYLYEDLQDPLLGLVRVAETDIPPSVVGGEEFTELSEYHQDRYFAGIGLDYNFLRNYTAGVRYFYEKQESDRINDDYNSHRVFITLSWQKEIARW